MLFNMLFLQTLELQKKTELYTRYNSLMTPYFGIFIMTLSTFSFHQIFKIFFIFWRKQQRIFAVFLLILGFIAYFVVHFALNLFSHWMKEQVNSSNTDPFILYVPPISIDNPQKHFREFLEKKMFFCKENMDKICALHSKVIFSETSNMGLKFLLVGYPGVGKTHIMQQIASLSPNGGIILKMSSLLQYEDLDYLNINDEINKINEIIEYCRKRKLILILDDSEIFLKERNSGMSKKKKRKSSKKRDTQRKLNNFIGILSNHWLSIISASDVTIIFASNMYHGLDMVMDVATARRLNEIFFVKLPNEDERRGIFANYLQDYQIIEDTCADNEENITDLAKITKGFTGRDIKKICINVKNKAKIYNRQYILLQDIIEEIRHLDKYHNSNIMKILDSQIDDFFKKYK